MMWRRLCDLPVATNQDRPGEGLPPSLTAAGPPMFKVAGVVRFLRPEESPSRGAGRCANAPAATTTQPKAPARASARRPSVPSEPAPVPDGSSRCRLPGRRARTCPARRPASTGRRVLHVTSDG